MLNENLNTLKSKTCPFCNSSIPLTDSTFRIIECYFNAGFPCFVDKAPVNRNKIDIELTHCPSCNEVIISAIGKDRLENLNIPLYPKSLAKQFPDYVPKAIREDYEEAYSILNLSPKASATLSRRCLQSMIRDFYKITKSRLIDEINALKNIIPATQWKAIDSLRSIGNIGAHMGKDVNVIIDVDPDEAQKLLKLIELLIDKWYIARHDEENLLSEIVSIADDKKTNHS